MKTAKLFLSPLRRAKSRRDGTLLTVCDSLRAFRLRQILLSALLFFFCANLHAQVTIGSLEEPKSGAVLDLNSTLKGGLLLSNVVLDNLYTIPHTNSSTANPFPGVTDANYDVKPVKDGFTGALVYHEGGNGIPAGIYVWNGTNWSPVKENCTAPALTLTASKPFVGISETVVFSVSSDASARCAEGETYEWFKSDVGGNVYSDPSFGSGASASTSFTSTGDYKVKVSATTPYSPDNIEGEKDITVTADGAPDPAKLTYTYGIVGETCLDVKKTGQGAVYDDRKDGFPDNKYTKTYKFHHGDDYSNLELFLDDPDHLVAGITYPPVSASGNSSKEFTVTFKSNVRELVPANGDSMIVKLYASYKPKDTPDETKYAYLEIRVEDGTCICPAKTAASPVKWLNFMCHNLGGLDIISLSQLITYEHHGDWYRFGAKNPSLVNEGTNNGMIDDWYATSTSDYPFYSGTGDWPVDEIAGNGLANPCPAGWRLPTLTEWVNVIFYNTPANMPATWESSGVTSFSNLKKLGDDLILPAAGVRQTSGAKLEARGSTGVYWSSNRYNNDSETTAYYTMGIMPNDIKTQFRSPAYANSVRCVQAE